MIDLTHTKKALEELDQFNVEWEEKWSDPDKINNKIALALFEELQDAEDEVRKAFYEDTKDRNCLENCMRVGIKWIRETVEKFG